MRTVEDAFAKLCQAQLELTHLPTLSSVTAAADATADALVALYGVLDDLRGHKPGDALAQVITDALEGEG